MDYYGFRIVMFCLLLNTSATLLGKESAECGDPSVRLIPYNYQGGNTFHLDRYCTNLNSNPLNSSKTFENHNLTVDYYVEQFITSQVCGALGILAGGTGFLVLGLAGDGGLEALGYSIVGAYVGYLFAVPIGVNKVGKDRIDDGSYWRALVGTMFGVGAGIGLTLASLGGDFDSNAMGFIAAFGLPPAISMLYYNSSSNLDYNRSKKEISVGQLGYYQDACGGLGVKMDLLNYRF